VAFGPDARTLASASNDNTVRQWDGLLWRDLAGLTTEVGSYGTGPTRRDWMQYVGAIPYRHGCAGI
jgi:hypothetical protein